MNALEKHMRYLEKCHGGVMRHAADACKISPSYWIRLRDGKNEPSDTILKRLGLEKIVKYVARTPGKKK